MKRMINDGLTTFKAPEGQVYDWKEPHTTTIIEEDGTISHGEEHLYANILRVGRFDDIENYILVPNPRMKKVDTND